MQKITCWLICGLCCPLLSHAGESFPGDSDHARPECRVSGSWLRLIAANREQGMPKEAAASDYFTRRREYGRVGSHIPNQITHENARGLTQFVYSFPAVPRDVFYQIGVYQCEVASRIPPEKTGDLMLLIAINGENCLKRLGDPVNPKLNSTVYTRFGNEKVDACLSVAAQAVWHELASGKP